MEEDKSFVLIESSEDETENNLETSPFVASSDISEISFKNNFDKTFSSNTEQSTSSKKKNKWKNEEKRNAWNWLRYFLLYI